MHKVNLQDKLAKITRSWAPHVVGELNDQYVKLAKLEGEYVWHQHAEEDEMFLVLEGTLAIHLRDDVVTLNAGEMFIVPRGVEHKPVAESSVHVLLFEPKTTRSTGNVDHEHTIEADRLPKL